MDRAPGSYMSGGYVRRTAPKQRPALARATVGIGCRVAKRDAHAMRARQHVRTSCVELREAAHGSGCSVQRRAAPCWRWAHGRMPTRSPKRRPARVEGELCRGSTFTLGARPRVHTLGVMVARAWSGLMCLETQGTRGGRQTLDLDGAAEVLTHGQFCSTYISEVPRSKPRWRPVAQRHARDQRLGRNVAIWYQATGGSEVKRGGRRAGRTNTGPNAGGVSALGRASGETGFRN